MTGRTVWLVMGLASSFVVGVPLACSASTLHPAEQDPGPALEPSGAEQEHEPLERPSALGRGASNVQRFAQDLRSKVDPQASIGVLPLAYFGAAGSRPTIPQLGLETADEIVAGIRLAGHTGAVFSPIEMNLFLSDLNVDQKSLFSIQGVVADGDRLGVDVIVFGTIRKPNTEGVGRNPLEFELRAYGFSQRRELATEAFALENKSENRRAFQLVDVTTSWVAGEALGGDAGGDLGKELGVAVNQLANRIVRLSDVPSIGAEKKIYVAPADSSRFVGAVSELRTMQKSLWREVAEREKETPAPGEPNPMDRPLVVNDISFPDVQQARDFVHRFQQSLMNTDSFRMGQTIASNLVEALRPMMDPRQVFNDLGFVSLSDNDQVEGELATGGLARSQKVRNALKNEGVAVVIQPRFERLAGHYSLRVEIYNLLTGSTTLSTHFRIHDRYSRQLAEELEVRGEDGEVVTKLEPVAEQARPEQAWDSVCARVSSGVVRLLGLAGDDRYLGHGTGFVVAKGVVMTNSHVLGGLRSAEQQAVQLASGEIRRLNLDVLADDEFLDVAVLRVEDLPDDLFVFEFAPAERVRMATEVAVLGHPKDTKGQVFSAGYLSSLDQEVPTQAGRLRPSYMYTCPTRGGNSGSPVMLRDGTVVAVNSHGMRGVVELVDSSGETSEAITESGGLLSELPGFAMGAPGRAAKGVLEAALKR